MGPRGIDLAPLIETRGGVNVHSCLDCARPMQQDRRKVAGWAPLPDVARHEARGRCQNCCQTQRNDGVSGRQRRRAAALEQLRAVVAEVAAGAGIRADDLAWGERAACRGARDPEQFAMPDQHRGGPTAGAVLAARRFCAACPVLAECAAFAARTHAVDRPVTGLWGGEWRTGVGSVVPITTKSPVRVSA